MHIEVTQTGTIQVIGSRRLDARLHVLREDLTTHARVADYLVSSQLVAATQRAALLRAAEALEVSDKEGWQCAVAALETPQHLEQLVQARAQAKCRAVAKVGAFTLADNKQAQQVFVYRLEM